MAVAETSYQHARDAVVGVAPGTGSQAQLLDYTAAEASIAKIESIRAAWEPYFAEATDGNGAVSTALKPRRK